MRNQMIIMIITIVVLVGASIILGREYSTTQKSIEELKLEKVEQREPLVNLELERMEAFFEQLPDDYDASEYDGWGEARHVADQLYDDSNKLFKREWGTLLALESQKRNVDPYIVYELLKIETGGQFDPSLVGPETKYGHAYGLAQFMKNTGPWIADMADLPYDDEKLFDPHFSIQLSVVYLEFLHNEYGDWNHALTAYHRGMTGLENYKDENGHAKSEYAVEIQENAEITELLAYD
ncbi:lytic transglycosylase domain-containing protein [Salipaludibacillus sp. CF4.18]|uniref:lytic transglycosylase domain-containing protein n=1 Tax=Salipaludibacillus sp. CF4.18 TaxID=3373081 RepID=UPI003EE6D133